MDTPAVTRRIRPMREVHPVRNAVVLALLALVLIAGAWLLWDERTAADTIARAVTLWK